MINMLDPIANK